MKKIIVTLALVAVAATSAFAQIGVGLGYQGKTYPDGNNDQNVGGFYVGAHYNSALTDAIGVAAGLDFNYLTGEEKTVGGKFKEMGIGLPILFNYAIPVAEGFVLRPFAGPTISFGLSNKYDLGGVSVDLYDPDLAGYQRFDILVGGGVALDVMEVIRVSVGYNKGLLNRVKDADPAVTTGGLHFGVAYLF